MLRRSFFYVTVIPFIKRLYAAGFTGFDYMFVLFFIEIDILLRLIHISQRAFGCVHIISLRNRPFKTRIRSHKNHHTIAVNTNESSRGIKIKKLFNSILFRYAGSQYLILPSNNIIVNMKFEQQFRITVQRTYSKHTTAYLD